MSTVHAPAAEHTSPAAAPPHLTVVVYGSPVTQGSKTVTRYGGLRDDNAATLKPWRQAVKHAALDALTTGHIGAIPVHQPPLDGPVRVEITFTLNRPASAPKRRRTWPAKQRSGDIDKLIRAAFDSFTDAGVWGDDAQVVDVTARKDYPGQLADSLDRPGAVIHVWPVTDEAVPA